MKNYDPKVLGAEFFEHAPQDYKKSGAFDEYTAKRAHVAWQRGLFIGAALGVLASVLTEWVLG